ncbi:MAG: proteasome subunit beta [Thermoprotei archaeon]|nr:MAG: proteasome subunit beta [Thermoprotei archaeon]
MERSLKTSKTTTVGLVVGEHVVLAADKRATAGTGVYHKRVKKIHRVDVSTAMTISGLVADAQFLVEEARYIAKKYRLVTGKSIGVHSLANYLGILLNAYLRSYPYIVQLLVGGLEQGKPALYYLDLYGTISREKYMATGSGSPIAFGVLESGYRDSMELKEAVELVYKAVAKAVLRDGYSGEGVDIVVIGPEGYSEETRLFKREMVKA